MKIARLRQISLILCCVVSLFAPSVAVCACARGENSAAHCRPEQQKLPENAASCEHRQNQGAPEAIQSVISEKDCCCVASFAAKVSVKSEIVKIEKQTPGFSTALPVRIEWTPRVVSVEIAGFVALFYLSDSFHNLAPGRAPPRL